MRGHSKTRRIPSEKRGESALHINMPQEQAKREPNLRRCNPITGRSGELRRSVNDAEARDIRDGVRGPAVIQTTCGFKPIVMNDGWYEETKAMVAKAYEVWRKKRGIPKYDHFGCCGIQF
jgi:hypothetical protein